MSASWIVVADAARARVFERIKAEDALHETANLVHGESALHAGDLRTGGDGGTMSNSSGSSFRRSEPHATPKETNAERFAKEIAEHLRGGRTREAFTSLVLIAEPRFLGRLRANIDSETAKRVHFTVDKNLVESSIDRIEQELRGHSR